MARREADFLNGVPELLVLRLLSQESMHGYQLVQRIKMVSRDEFSFGESCIYPLLHRLRRDALLTSRRDLVAGRSRVVYSVTKKGEKHLGAQVSRWQRVTGILSSLVEGDIHGSNSMAG
jgi:PadR family transcriptional regulator PadR